MVGPLGVAEPSNTFISKFKTPFDGRGNFCFVWVSTDLRISLCHEEFKSFT